jgi:hypothetical protein
MPTRPQPPPPITNLVLLRRPPLRLYLLLHPQPLRLLAARLLCLQRHQLRVALALQLVLVGLAPAGLVFRWCW